MARATDILSTGADLLREPFGEPGDPLGAVQRKLRGGGAVAVVAHHDRDTVVAHRIERILIGDVVADIEE